MNAEKWFDNEQDLFNFDLPPLDIESAIVDFDLPDFDIKTALANFEMPPLDNSAFSDLKIDFDEF